MGIGREGGKKVREPVFCAAYLACIGFFANIIGEALPRNWFCADKMPYILRAWEKDGKVYEKLKIRSWKDKLPDVSKVRPSMLPKSLESFPSDMELCRLIRETCVAEMMHVSLIVAGLPCAWIWTGPGGLAISSAWAVLNLPFILIQRYNRPRLLRLLVRMGAKGNGKGA